MKKIIWVGVGVVLLLAGIIMVGQKKAQSTSEQPRRDRGNVGHASGLSSEEFVHGESLASTTAGSRTYNSLQSVDKPAVELSTAVKALLGLDENKHTYPSLLSAINELGDELSADDLAALMDMLNLPNDRFPEGMRPIEINAVKNDVLDRLLRQEQLPEGLGLQMVEMAGNPDNDPVWRDYCVQFMQPFYESRSKVEGSQVESHGAGGSTSSDSGDAVPLQDELVAIHDAMFRALDERDSTIAGTSLIGLELLSRTHDEFDREMIVSKAAEIASDEAASSASRMTALRLSAMTEDSESAVDAARSLAQTGETVLLRSAAIVTLGEIGASDDRELLESYALAENRQIAAAAKMALAKMDAR